MIILYFILFLATLTDFKSYKIPNRLVIIGLICGLICHLSAGSVSHVLMYFLHAILIWILTMPLFAFHVIGGGDCKLFSLCALFTGVVRTMTIGIYAFIFSGVICAILLLFRQFFPRVKQVHTIHFSIYILLGALVEGATGGKLWDIGSLFLTGRAGL